MNFLLTAFLLLNWVVLDTETNSQGNVQSIELLHGANPLDEIAISNVRQWTLPADSRVGIIYLFRPADLFGSPPIELQQHGSSSRTNRAPFPKKLWDPGYNPQSVAEGVVVLEVRISSTGTIENVRIVSDPPVLGKHTEDAVRSWRFDPALRNGSPVEGTVMVVVSYLRPVLNPATTTYPSFQGPTTPVTPPPTGTFNDRPGAPAPRPF